MLNTLFFKHFWLWLLKEPVITAVRKHINRQVVPQINMLYAAKEYTLTSFFGSQRSGSKIDNWSSKVQPVTEPENSKVQPLVDILNWPI
jgi:hypothetical protein